MVDELYREDIMTGRYLLRSFKANKTWFGVGRRQGKRKADLRRK